MRKVRKMKVGATMMCLVQYVRVLRHFSRRMNFLHSKLNIIMYGTLLRLRLYSSVSNYLKRPASAASTIMKC